MLPYLLHVAVLIALCYLSYILLLKRETFYQLNRSVLLLGMLTVFTLPMLQIPAGWSMQNLIGSVELSTKKKEVLPSPTLPDATVNTKTPEKETQKGKKTLDSRNTKIKKSEQFLEKKISTEENVLSKFRNFSNLNWATILFYIYCLGLGIFAINFLIQFMALIVMRLRHPVIKDGQFQIIEVADERPPFSFLNHIFINPSQYDWETYEQILEHEKIHVAQRHTLDILLAELLVVAQWFNPFAWWYRRAVENNLEYLTDSVMLHQGTPKESYQMNLLKVAVPQHPLSLGTNYNQSTLKQRIMMMNIKKSSLSSSWKYLFLLPILGLSIITLNSVQVQAQDQPVADEEETTATITTMTNSVTTKKTPTSPVNSSETDFQVKPSVTSATDKNFQSSTGRTYTDWHIYPDGNEICLTLHGSSEGGRGYHNWYRTECEPKANFMNIPEGDNISFQIDREAGLFTMTGDMRNGEGRGKVDFKVKEDFRQYLKTQGFKKLTDNLMLHVALTDINKSYLNYLKSIGYRDLDTKDLEALAYQGITQKEFKNGIDVYATYGLTDLDLQDVIQFNIHGVTPEYISELQKYGFDDLDANEIIQFAIHDVDADFIKELHDMGFKDIDHNDIVQFSIHDIDANYVRELGENGLEDLDSDEIVQFAIHDVDADFIKELKDMGFDDLDEDDIVQFAIHNVDARYIKEIRENGFTDLRADEIVQFAIHNVDTDFIKELRDMGFDDLDENEIVQFAIHNVNARYIKEIRENGFTDLRADEIVQFAIHNVDTDFIREVSIMGFDNVDEQDIIQFAIHNVDSDYLQDLKRAGLQNFSPQEVVQASIHHVDPNFIADLKSKGYDNLDINELVQLSIHHVDSDFINDMADLGYKNLDINELVQASIHHVDADEVEELQDLGIKNLDINTLIQMNIHHVDADYIRKMSGKGYKNLSPKEYIQLKIGGGSRNKSHHNDDDAQ